MAFKALVCLMTCFALVANARVESEKLFFVTAKAKDKVERNLISSVGVAIDGVLSDSVTFVANGTEIHALRRKGIHLTVDELPQPQRDFPTADAAFHTHAETLAALD